MITIHRSAIVPYSVADMFRLVSDIESYPLFLPWCKSSHILSRNEDEVRATLDLVWSGIHKSFTTCNRLQKDKMIEMRLIDGPFKHLEGFWRFENILDEGTRVILDLEFEFAGKLLALAFGPVFNHVANSLVDAFCQRAMDVYGKKSLD